MAEIKTPPPLNRTPSDPSLAELLVQFNKQIMLDMNCHAIATVQEFDPETQTARATMNYTKTFSVFEPNSIKQKQTQKNYPIIVGAPVIFLGGGTSSLTFPVAKGDECLVIFNDRDIDNWLVSGQVSPVASARLHSFSDAIILVGLRSTPKMLADFDTLRADLRNGNAHVAVGPTLIKIYNASTTLNTQLQALTTQLQALVTQINLITVICATPGNPSSVPVNSAAIASIGTQIGSIATAIGGLLE